MQGQRVHQVGHLVEVVCKDALIPQIERQSLVEVLLEGTEILRLVLRNKLHEISELGKVELLDVELVGTQSRDELLHKDGSFGRSMLKEAKSTLNMRRRNMLSLFEEFFAGLLEEVGNAKLTVDAVGKFAHVHHGPQDLHVHSLLRGSSGH